MTYNVERLERLGDDIKHEAELFKHDQGTWGRFRGTVEKLIKHEGTTWASVTCPTAACAAGWTVIGQDAAMLFPASAVGQRLSGDVTTGYCLTTQGEVRDIEEYAAELLGLDDAARRHLFFGCSTTEEVLAAIDMLIVAAKHDRSWEEQMDLTYTHA